MRKLEITLSDEQYEHIQQEIKYGGRTMLEEETFGGFEITLHVGVPKIYTYLEMNYINKIDLGEVEWSFSKNIQSLKN